MNSLKTCMRQGHKNSIAEHICVYIDCPQKDRWCCTECLIGNSHSHGSRQSNYILHFNEFIKKIQVQQNPNLAKWQQLLQMVAELIELLQSFKILIKDNLEKNNINKNYLDLLTNQDQVLSLSSQDITNLLKYQPLNILIYDSLEDNYLKINKKKQDIDFLFKSSINMQQEVLSKSLNITMVREINPEFRVVKLETQTSYNLFAAQISPCEKFVAFGGDDSKLKIFNLVSGKTNYVNLNDQIRSIEIQKDSKQTFIGGFHGNVILLKNNFQEQYTYQYHSKTIYQIIIISNSEILTSSSDQTIVRYDYLYRKVMSTINLKSFFFDFDRNFARCIDINPENLMVAGGSNQQAIHIWDLDGAVLIKQQEKVNQNVRIINFFDKYTKLLTLETDGLQYFQSKLKNVEMKIWFINLNQRRLELEKQFKDQQNICHLQYYRNQEYIVLILEQSIKIMTSDMTLVQQIYHEVVDLYPYQCKQLESITKLLVKGKSKYYLQYFFKTLYTQLISENEQFFILCSYYFNFIDQVKLSKQQNLSKLIIPQIHFNISYRQYSNSK